MKWIFLAGFTPSRGSLYAPSRLRRRAIFNPTHTSVSGSAIILFSEWNLMITKTIKRIGMIPTIALARARGDGSFWAGSRRPPQGPQHPADSVRRFKVSFRIAHRSAAGWHEIQALFPRLGSVRSVSRLPSARSRPGSRRRCWCSRRNCCRCPKKRSSSARRGAGKGRSAGARARLSPSPPVQGRRRSQEKARSFSRSRRSRSRPRSNSARRNSPPPRRRSRTPISSCSALRSSSR